MSRMMSECVYCPGVSAERYDPFSDRPCCEACFAGLTTDTPPPSLPVPDPPDDPDQYTRLVADVAGYVLVRGEGLAHGDVLEQDDPLSDTWYRKDDR